MNAKLMIPKAPLEVVKYPCLKRLRQEHAFRGDVVVLFTSPGKGTAIVTPGTIGESGGLWAESYFEMLPPSGVVQLSN